MAGEGSKPKPSKDDAFAYIKAVKDTFPNDSDNKYRDFADIMHNFKTERIDRDGCIEKVKELFKGNANLINGFNKFLPESLEIENWREVPIRIDNT